MTLSGLAIEAFVPADQQTRVVLTWGRPAWLPMHHALP
jgi:hypothetical protein